MARLTQIRGMLLEESLLHLLERAGYKTVVSVENDPTLDTGPAGLKVRGRGSAHQIDAIADFQIPPPFSHPQRLLVEAKCLDLHKHVGLPVLRGAVGVLKDVAEFWMVAGGEIPKQRYHYQYAMFSANAYTSDAQRYAFAHDIFLIPLAASTFFQPVIAAVRNIRSTRLDDRENANIRIDMTALRSIVRERIGTPIIANEPLGAEEGLLSGLREFIQRSKEIRYALLATLAGRFPIFLVPSPEVRTQAVREEYFVRIYRGQNDETWYLRDSVNNQNLFSFDLPRELLLEYANQGMLTERSALRLKEDTMSNIQAFWVEDQQVRLVRFRLDAEWAMGLRNQLMRRREQ
jgi:hypothetical protein